MKLPMITAARALLLSLFMSASIPASAWDVSGKIQLHETVIFLRQSNGGRGMSASSTLWTLAEVTKILSGDQVQIREWAHPSRYGLKVESVEGTPLYGDRIVRIEEVVRTAVTPLDGKKYWIRSAGGRNWVYQTPVILFENGVAGFFMDEKTRRDYLKSGFSIFTEGPVSFRLADLKTETMDWDSKGQPRATGQP